MQNAQADIYIAVIIGMAGTFMLGASLIYFYIRYRGKFHRQREEIQRNELAHQKQLLYATVQTQDNERKRIGRDMHDDIGSMLSHLRMQVNNLAAQVHPPVASPGVENCKAIIDHIMVRVRTISHQLLPPGIELFGLADAVEDLCQDTAETSGLDVDFVNETGGTLTHLDIDVALALYRVIQQLLTNTIAHAKARQVKIAMHDADDGLHVIYSDDGIGYDMGIKTKGMGMQNISSRLQVIDAAYTITTAPDAGFNIHILYHHYKRSHHA